MAGEIILITGGARSGKSTYAEERAKELSPYASDSIVYVATCIADDEEMHDRVKKHKERRPQQWKTLEVSEKVGEGIMTYITNAGSDSLTKGVLLDCITLLVSQCMANNLTNWDIINPVEANRVEQVVIDEIESLILASERLSCPFIIVTNEIGMGLVPEYPAGRLFRDMAGRANQMLARKAKEVVLCVSGIPVVIKQ